jgi:hypothetical protein
MALTKLQFRPGVNRETTSYTNEGGWFDCEKIRFRFGTPEKIGGLEQILGRVLLRNLPRSTPLRCFKRDKVSKRRDSPQILHKPRRRV